ncbi:MAG: GNAT family N-acetyltransferase [Lachnospiraceae bacterium]|nr:GNAT family N-acetyltransferase [Lachnospiraceae bacterium]
MNIALEKVEIGKKDILFRILQYSLFEESINDGNCMGQDALFAYPWFEDYFTEIERKAYFIRDQEMGTLLGFAMINTCMKRNVGGHSIAEFMIIPKFRRNKIGTKAASMCFDMHRGNWEVSPSYGSRQAYLFWKSVVDEYTGGENTFEEGSFFFNSEY